MATDKRNKRSKRRGRREQTKKKRTVGKRRQSVRKARPQGRVRPDSNGAAKKKGGTRKRSALADLQDQHAAQTRRLKAERQRAQRLRKELSDHQLQVQQAQQTLNDLQSRSVEQETRLDDESRRVLQLKVELSSRDAQASELRAAIDGSEREREAAAARLASSESAIHALQHEHVKLYKRLDDLTLRLKRERKQRRVLEGELSRGRARANSHQATISALTASNNEVQTQLAAIQSSRTWKVVAAIAVLRRRLRFWERAAPDETQNSVLPVPQPTETAKIPAPNVAASALGTDAALVVAAAARSSSTRRKLPLSALVITWDIGHNPVGRSYMLAEVIDRVFRHTVIAGFQFPRYGKAIWEPLRNARIPVIRIPGKPFPEFGAQIERIASVVRPDIVFACKPRLPSLQLGLRIKEISGCPLILDIDDHELAFFDDQTPLTLEAIESMPAGALNEETEPYGKTWTRISESLIDSADLVLVSNSALQQRFGGHLLPHVRDETTFIPSGIHDRAKMRRHFGIPVNAKVVLFFGTPRRHKGIATLVDAVGRIDDPDIRLVVVGTAPDRSIVAMLNEALPGRIIQLPNQPFSAIPQVLACADAVALPQDVHHPVSHFQLPAKAIDAVAMGVPLLVSRTRPLMDLVQQGVATPLDESNLVTQLQGAVQHRASRDEVETRRARFLETYSYAAAAEQIRSCVELAVRSASKANYRAVGTRLTDAQRRVFSLSSNASQPGETGRDVVVFWKQNDTTLYGRRHDMVIKYLASRSDTRRILVFDAPISMQKLIELRDNADRRAQHRDVYVRTEEKRLGLRDQSKIRYRVFAYQPGIFKYDDGPDRKPALSDAYIKFIRSTLAAEGIEAGKSVFWFYPKSEFIPRIVKRLTPGRTVVDVVDDHRAWPNVSEQEVARLTNHYREVLSLADVAIANCEPLCESMREFCPAIKLIPNGCDTDFGRAEPSDSPEFERLKAWPGRIIGFTGNLESKIDIELLSRVATEFPDCLLALVGSTHMNPAVTGLERYTNVVMPGVVPYESVGEWIRRFHVAIIPHLRSDLTKNMNPLKLFVYAAHGVPVVSTAVQNLDEGLDLLLIARSADDFIEKLRAVLSGKIRFRASRDYAQKNTWESRLKRVVDDVLRFPERSASGSTIRVDKSIGGPSS